MFCPNCGVSVAESQLFCHNCGKKIFQKSLDEESGGKPVIMDQSDIQQEQLQNEDLGRPKTPLSEQVSIPQAPSVNINLNQSQNNSSALGGTLDTAVSYLAQPPEMKSRETAGVLCLLLGWIGAHDLYVGKIGMGVIKIILTITGIGYFVSAIWQFIDVVCILNGNYRDHWGRPLVGEPPITKILLFLPILMFIIGILVLIGFIISISGVDVENLKGR